MLQGLYFTADRREIPLKAVQHWFDRFQYFIRVFHLVVQLDDVARFLKVYTSQVKDSKREIKIVFMWRMNLQSRIEFFSIERKSRSTSLEYLRKSSPLLKASCTNWSSRFSCIWLSNMSHSSDTEFLSKQGELAAWSLNWCSSLSESFCNSFNNSAVWKNKNKQSKFRRSYSDLPFINWLHCRFELTPLRFQSSFRSWLLSFSLLFLSSNNVFFLFERLFSFLRTKVI